MIYGYPVIFPPRTVFLDKALMAKFLGNRIKQAINILFVNGFARGQKFFYSVGSIEAPYYMGVEFPAAIFSEGRPEMIFIDRPPGICVNKNK